jgi:small subunit ribosomal protein S6e
MPAFKFIINDKAQSFQVEKDQTQAPILGKRIGEEIDAGFLGLEGYVLSIAGGSDKDGFPMRSDIEGQMKKFLILKKGVGFSGKLKGRKKKRKATTREGVRKRKLVRGNTISTETAQVNCTVKQYGPKPLAELIPKAPKAEEAKK